VKCSPIQFYIWQKTGCGIRYFLSFETENRKCSLLRHYLNLCELNFTGQHIVNVSPWTRNCPNLYTHETQQPNHTYIQVVLKFKDVLWSSIAHLKVCDNMLCKNQSAIKIINNKQSNLLLKNLTPAPALPQKNLTPAPHLFSKIVKTPAGVNSDTPAPVHLCQRAARSWAIHGARSMWASVLNMI